MTGRPDYLGASVVSRRFPRALLCPDLAILVRSGIGKRERSPKTAGACSALRFSFSSTALLALLLVFPPFMGKAAPLVNPGFETGDFTGWTTTGFNDLGLPVVAANLGVFPIGGEHFAEIFSGFNGFDATISRLEGSFVGSSSDPIMSIELGLLDSSPDPTGSGTSSFLDSLGISLVDALTSETFLVAMADRNGVHINPLAQMPGFTALAPGDPTFNFLSLDHHHTLVADLSAFAGQDLILSFDMFNADDGLSDTWLIRGVECDPISGFKPEVTIASPGGEIPEPSESALFFSVLLIVIGGKLIGRLRKAYAVRKLG